MKKNYLVFFYLLAALNLKSQVKIGDNPTILNSSSILELESTNKGLLIPRLTTTQMNAISNPALGLFIFNLTDSLFYLRLDSGWTRIATGVNQWVASGNNVSNINSGNIGIGTNAPAQKLEINGSTQIDSSVYLPNTTSTGLGIIYKGGLPFMHTAGNSLQQNIFIGQYAGSFNFNPENKKNIGIGEGALSFIDGADNVAIGYQAAHILAGGSSLTDSYKNTFIGYLSGANATGGINNVSVGNEAGYLLSAGSSGNVLLGSGAGRLLTSGLGNALIGNNVGTTTGWLNTGIGGNSGVAMTNGSYNCWLGADAYKSNKLGNYNTVIGAEAGRDDTISNSQYNVYLGAFSGVHTQGAGNVFIGSFSGQDDNTNLSNTLIINNYNNLNHLINGKFDTHKVGINKTLSTLDYTLDVGGEIRVGSLTSDPVAANGVFYYNNTTNKFRAVENNTWKDMLTSNSVINSSSNPTAADISDGTYQVWKNTSTNSVYIWVNDNGVMKKIQFL